MVQWLYGLIVQWLYSSMVIWLYGYVVIVVYSNQVEWIIPKRFIPIWLMVIGFYIVIVSRNCNLK